MKVRAARKAPVVSGAAYQNNTRRARLLDPATGVMVWLPYLPDEIEESGLADQWEQLSRPGRKPLLQRTGRALPVVSFTARLVAPGRDSSVGDLVRDLKSLARSATPVRLDMAGRTFGSYRITGLTIRERDQWTEGGQPVDVVADVELTTTSDAAEAVGPVKRKLNVSGTVKNAVKRGRKKRG